MFHAGDDARIGDANAAAAPAAAAGPPDSTQLGGAEPAQSDGVSDAVAADSFAPEPAAHERPGDFRSLSSVTADPAAKNSAAGTAAAAVAPAAVSHADAEPEHDTSSSPAWASFQQDAAPAHQTSWQMAASSDEAQPHEDAGADGSPLETAAPQQQAASIAAPAAADLHDDGRTASASAASAKQPADAQPATSQQPDGSVFSIELPPSLAPAASPVTNAAPHSAEPLLQASGEAHAAQAPSPPGSTHQAGQPGTAADASADAPPGGSGAPADAVPANTATLDAGPAAAAGAEAMQHLPGLYSRSVSPGQQREPAAAEDRMPQPGKSCGAQEGLLLWFV